MIIIRTLTVEEYFIIHQVSGKVKKTKLTELLTFALSNSHTPYKCTLKRTCQNLHFVALVYHRTKNLKSCCGYYITLLFPFWYLLVILYLSWF